jgi:HlyD family secretion protein
MWCVLDNRRRRGVVGVRRWVFWLLSALAASGCGHHAKVNHQSVAAPLSVQVISPQVRDIVRVVGQPSFIESYERTSIYPKVTGYIEKWNVDIGDQVKKGDVLAKLFVPELVEDLGTKNATVTLDRDRVDLAQKMVDVATADVKTAKAHVVESTAILAKFQSEVDRWATEVGRLKNEVKRGIVDPQILLESTNQWKSSVAARDSAEATVTKAKAELSSRDAKLAAAKVDVAVAHSDLSVAQSEARRMEAWVGYITLTAPYDGVIVARNANTGDFVLPLRGDPTAMERSPHLAPGGTAAPIYVVDRTDIVRIFVDIPEQDADYVHKGTKANVLVRAYRDEEIPATVTRTSWALNVKSRTLRAEVDLPNPNSQLLPGMYAYADVIIEHQGVRALPVSALTHRGDRTYYWRYENGKAMPTEVQTGVSDGEWIEVTRRTQPGQPEGPRTRRRWATINGSERVILGDLSVLAEGTPVRIAPGAKESNVAAAGDESPPKTARNTPTTRPQ